jgi:glycosyltransferase involved in cell wall biosynthesis
MDAAPVGVDIVCLADMEWDYAVWTNRQHVMSRLPRLATDVRVLYVAPPRFVLSEHVRGAQLGHVRLRRSGKRLGQGLWQIDERLWVLQPRIPVSNKAALRRARDAYCNWLGWRVAAAARRLRMTSPVIWSYSPLGELVLNGLRLRARVYDVVDDYGALAHYRRLLGDDVVRLDREATAAADVVFVTSERLARQRRELNERCVEVGNAADVRLFASARANQPRPADLGVTTGPIVCFHGTLSSQKLDAVLVARLAARRTDWTFLLLGHEPDRNARAHLGGLDNVRLLGRKLYHELPAYLAASDVAIVPYRVNDYTLGIDALKAYECLAAGLPVVATDLPCFAGLQPHVRTARTEAEFEQELERTIAAPPVPRPVEELEVYSWTSKAGRQLAEVRRVLEEGSR